MSSRSRRWTARRSTPSAHRVVHGGPRFREPVLIDEAVESRDRARWRRSRRSTTRRRSPGSTRRARRFPSSRTSPCSTRRSTRRSRGGGDVRGAATVARGVGHPPLRVPRALGRVGVERTREIVAGSPDALVVCHLGGGCSVTAVRDGALGRHDDGLQPARGRADDDALRLGRPGRARLRPARARANGRRARSRAQPRVGTRRARGGRRGSREIEAAAAAGDVDARLAVEVFVHRLAGAIAAMAAATGGLDALVFTAGIGERSAPVRGMTCERLGFLGVELDQNANAGAEPDCDITADGSRVRVLVVRAREELVAARAARALLGL